MENKVAALGSFDFVIPFSTLGIDTFAVSDSTEQIQKGAAQIIEAKYALIVVAENIAPAVEQIFEPLQNKTLPIIITIPFTTESKGLATEALGRILKIATGVNILGN